MLNQTDMRRSSEQREADLALQKEAAVDASEAVAKLGSAAEVSRGHSEVLQIQMQDMKRQKTVGDFALLTATRLAASLKTAHELALDTRTTTVGLNERGGGGVGGAQDVGGDCSTAGGRATRFAGSAAQRGCSRE